MTRIKINCSDITITTDYIDRLLSTGKRPQDICLVIPNTKKQSHERLEEIANKYPDIIISVTGGLDPRKQKFNNEHYQGRTYYNSRELSKIVKFFYNMERQMDINWTYTQKAMFAYKYLYDRMEYVKDNFMPNGRDVARNLCGLLYGKATCSGFSMIYKEVLDRLGIKNIYQNVQDHHSWVLAYLDGHYRPIELTWEVNLKQPDGITFFGFGRLDNFYDNKHHNLTNEQEEQTYPLITFTQDEIQKNYDIITSPKNPEIDLNELIAKPLELNVSGKQYIISKTNNGCKIEGEPKRNFIRKDGSVFMLIKISKQGELYSYCYLDIKNDKVRVYKIYSETELDKEPTHHNSIIADELLSIERIERKIKGFNGYVGKIGPMCDILYNDSFERDKLNVYR